VNTTLSNGEFRISTDRSELDVLAIHRFLSEESYWCPGIPLATVQRSIEHSLCFGVFAGKRQVGFARVVSDFATVAYLGDVFVLPEFRGRGLSKWLMQTINEHPDLQGLRRWVLLTRDAHDLYQQFGWQDLAAPDRWMERHNPNVYQS
jgi:GNAT superfamily N-acetyltransferase